MAVPLVSDIPTPSMSNRVKEESMERLPPKLVTVATTIAR